MGQKQGNSSLTNADLNNGRDNKETDTAEEAFKQFISSLQSLKELDLEGIEPILPPTFKEVRYKNK
ncbi:hypothetical protein P9684_11990 [Bacillus atrophaeus]|uniref:hypothetical protein n=1 Tax=Bacillus atrophaeus TaxID=1452 RepID=UPI002E1EDFD3|nr:hypothetical protein [Bacillus atrophaeus]